MPAAVHRAGEGIPQQAKLSVLCGHARCVVLYGAEHAGLVGQALRTGLVEQVLHGAAHFLRLLMSLPCLLGDGGEATESQCQRQQATDA